MERALGACLVRGTGDVGSAVALALFRAGHAVVLHDEPAPAYSRRGAAFVDALFDGEAALDGVRAQRCDGAELVALLRERAVIPLLVDDFREALQAALPRVLVDARMRKRAVPEAQRGLAPLTIGLGPNFVAGETTDLVVETAWGERLGAIIRSGRSLPLSGEPKPVEGVARERYVYAPAAGVFRSACAIGQRVSASEVVGHLGAQPVLSPLAGCLRGLTRSGVPVKHGTKIVEVVPEAAGRLAFEIGERQRRIAAAVARAVAEFDASG